MEELNHLQSAFSPNFLTGTSQHRKKGWRHSITSKVKEPARLKPSVGFQLECFLTMIFKDLASFLKPNTTQISRKLSQSSLGQTFPGISPAVSPSGHWGLPAKHLWL